MAGILQRLTSEGVAVKEPPWDQPAGSRTLANREGEAMNAISIDEYRRALHEEVCGVCSCFIPSEPGADGVCARESAGGCPVFFKLPEIVESVSAVKDDSIGPYVEELRGRVCAHCENQDEHQVCRLRDADDPSRPSWCILDTYFSLIVGSIERVRKSHAR